MYSVDEQNLQSYTGSWYTLMPDHNATTIPQGIISGYGVVPVGPSTTPAAPYNQWAMTQFPFWKAGISHWAIGANNRWEVDDYANNNLCR